MHGDPRIVEVIRPQQRIQWIGHVERLSRKRTTKIMLHREGKKVNSGEKG